MSRAERLILVGSDISEAARERLPISGRDCWINLHDIGETPPALAPWPGGPVVAHTRGISGVTLRAVPGSNDIRYAAADGQLSDAVPPSVCGRQYRPTLRDAAGKIVPYSSEVWTVDSIRGIVEFRGGRTPRERGFTPPFTIDYWRYVGAFATGPVRPVAVAAPIPQPHFKKIAAGSGINIVDRDDILTISIVAMPVCEVATVPRAPAQTEAPAIVMPQSAAPKTLKADTMAANSGLMITEEKETILMSVVLTGFNVGSSGHGLFRDKSKNSLNFKKIAAGPGLKIGDVQDTLVISLDEASMKKIVLAMMSGVAVADKLAIETKPVAVATEETKPMAVETETKSMATETKPAAVAIETKPAAVATETKPMATKEIKPAATTNYWCFREERPRGTHGGTFTAGRWMTRALNVASDGRTLAENQIRLQPGRYRVRATAPAHRVRAHKTRLYNVSTGVSAVAGANAFSQVGGDTQTTSEVAGMFTVTEKDTRVELQHQAEMTSVITGMGMACGFDDYEIYAVVELWKIA